MQYKVLYRKYRPDNFENIVGQNYIVQTLKNSVINNKISHAYIFSGPRGTGKTSTAKVFAKAINCLNPKDGSPCGECEFCKNFQDNPDIIEIDAASNNGVEQIRTIIDNIKLAPSNGKYKVYIIDEVHMLTPNAFNALLLTLEEPPSHTVFILATTNIENVPITILSRCQRFDFQKIAIEDLVTRLKLICEKEQISASDDALTEIAYLSEGGLRDALSLLDQLSKNNEEITLELVEKQIKIVSQKNIIDLLNLIEQNDVEKIITTIDEYRSRAIDYKNLAKKIIDVASNRAKNIKKSGRIERLNFEDYKSLILKLTESISKFNINVDSYVILELMLLEFVNTNNSEQTNVSKENSQEKTANIEEVDNNFTESEKSELSTEFIERRINNCFVDAKKSSLEDAKLMLKKYLESVNATGKVRSILLDSNVVAASDKNLILTCNNEHNVITANNMLQEIEQVLNNEVGKDYKIIFLTNKKWLQEKDAYIVNLKQHKVYVYQNEEETKQDDIMLTDVFDKTKIEII